MNPLNPSNELQTAPKNIPPVDGVEWLSLAQAFEQVRISPNTLRKQRKELEERGAVITKKGWTIPRSALDQMNLLKPSNELQTVSPVEPLNEELINWKTRALVAESKLEAKEETLNAYKTALALLEEAPKRKGWFWRK